MKYCACTAFLIILSNCSSDSTDQSSLLNTNWDTYLGDSARSHYSELDQITAENVSQLELAWTYDSGELREGGSSMYTSPLVIDGILYGLSPKLVAFALRNYGVTTLPGPALHNGV